MHKNMTKWKLITIYLLITVCIAVVSGYVGVKEGMKAGGFTSSMAELMFFSNNLSTQLKNANCEGLKKTYYDYLSMLEKYKNVEDSFMSGTAYHADQTLIHTRLARIERKLNNETVAQKHIKIAQTACEQLDWKDCSENKLIEITKKLEKNNPILCLSTQ